MESLEQRRMLDATAIESRITVRQIAEDGVLINQSGVKIPFDNGIQLADADEIRVRGYAIDPSTGNQKKMVINVTDVRVQEDNRTLAITTDRMIPRGARFYIDDGLLIDGDGEDVQAQVVQSPKGLSKTQFSFASRAFKWTNPDLFLPSIFPGANSPTTASSVLDEATVEPALEAFLQKKVDAGTIDQAKMDSAMARFNDPIDSERIPDHNLRAALLSLVGTFAEQAIAVFLDGENLSGEPYTIVAFAETSPDAVLADTQVTENGRLRTRVKPQFAGEPFQVLSGVLAHEAMHQDAAPGLQEEIIGNIFETTIWAKQLEIDAAPASAGTVLVDDQNTELLAMLNSGRGAFPNVGTLEAPLVNDLGVFYGASAQTGGAYTSYDNFIRRQYQARGAVSTPTAGNPTLDIYMDAFTDDAPAGAAFGEELIVILDRTLHNVLDFNDAMDTAEHLALRL
jgi:hypothetical protein